MNAYPPDGTAKPASNPRDTQFLGFACRLLQDLLDQCAYVTISECATGGDSARCEQLIAQRVYDLVSHEHPQLLEVHA